MSFSIRCEHTLEVVETRKGTRVTYIDTKLSIVDFVSEITSVTEKESLWVSRIWQSEPLINALANA